MTVEGLKIRPYRYSYKDDDGVEHKSRTVDRYYVDVDDVPIGWACKNSDGWSFYATLDSWFEGHKLTWGNKTRRDAVLEGLSELRIRHYGRIVRLSRETWKEESVRVDCDRLESIWEQLLDEKYGLDDTSHRRISSNSQGS